MSGPLPAKTIRGRKADGAGREAEALVARLYQDDGWEVLGQRVRTKAGEIDLVVRQGGTVALVEVKARATARAAAHSLGKRQRLRLVAAAELLLASNPDWAMGLVRFDVVVLGAEGRAYRIADAFRVGD